MHSHPRIKRINGQNAQGKVSPEMSSRKASDGFVYQPKSSGPVVISPLMISGNHSRNVAESKSLLFLHAACSDTFWPVQLNGPCLCLHVGDTNILSRVQCSSRSLEPVS